MADLQTLLREIFLQLAQAQRDVPTLRIVRKSLSKSLANADATLVLDLADRLVRRGSFADSMIAYEVVAGHRPARAALDEKRLIRWSRGLDDWGSVDLFGCTLAGQAWREGLLSDAVIDAWTVSPDRWMRRLALVCTVPLNIKSRGGSGDAVRTLRICAALADDRDDMVVKALSWALRELAKRDAAAVREFIDIKRDRLAPRVIREVTTKLTTGKKTRLAKK